MGAMAKVTANDLVLTQGREAFAVNLSLGMEQTDAHIAAFPNDTSTRKTHRENSSRLAKDSKVVARVAELRNKAVSPKIATLIELKEHATKVMNDKDASLRDQLAGNKLVGEYGQYFVKKIEDVTPRPPMFEGWTSEDFLEALQALRAIKARIVEGTVVGEPEALEGE
ncbi:hypothetical protein LCGC14_2625540 [marine sediment metagenome]|uniref:Terminase small subunit n=1 Tax=marine sediment metagenome TaxID=412755 RepID=A0A0F9A1W3_9ZZZZ